MKIFVHTLGCRLNYYETEALLDEFIRRAGACRTENFEEAAVIIVNTCAVTRRSTARSRKSVRYFRKHNNTAVIAVTGCVVQVSPDEFPRENSTVLIPNTEKHELVNSLSKFLGVPLLSHASHSENDRVLFPATAPTSIARTRASLKIQDGCDNNCSYCIVPRARGHSRSQPRETVMEQAEQLRQSGYREILLTGVDLVAYGRDIYDDSYRLPELVRDLLKLGGFRIRLSSTEPIGLTPQMLSSIALPGVCRHFHLPVQSGSNRILELMGRNYTRDTIIELLDSYTNLFPGVNIGTDIIVGFPGETETDFNYTVDLISHPAISYLHVFPFSPRPETRAASMKPTHTETITARAEFLRKYSEDARKRFRKSRIGEEVTVLAEGRYHPGTNNYIGMSDNYIPVIVPLGHREGDLFEITLEDSNICWATR